jgi:hypothetical protein
VSALPPAKRTAGHIEIETYERRTSNAQQGISNIEVRYSITFDIRHSSFPEVSYKVSGLYPTDGCSVLAIDFSLLASGQWPSIRNLTPDTRHLKPKRNTVCCKLLAEQNNTFIVPGCMDSGRFGGKVQ